MQPGRMDRRAAFSRRQDLSVRDRGAFVTFLTVWAEYRAASGREQAQAGQVVAFEAATLRIWDTPRARNITVGDRVTVKGADHRIMSVGLPSAGAIELAIVTDLAGTS